MAKTPYLVRRKNVFYFRLGVPADLREIVKSREIIQSLRTEDSDEATRRALKLAAHFKSLLHDLKTGKASPTIRVNSLDLLSAKDVAQETAKPLETVIDLTIPYSRTHETIRTPTNSESEHH